MKLAFELRAGPRYSPDASGERAGERAARRRGGAAGGSSVACCAREEEALQEADGSFFAVFYSASDVSNVAWAAVRMQGVARRACASSPPMNAGPIDKHAEIRSAKTKMSSATEITGNQSTMSAPRSAFWEGMFLLMRRASAIIAVATAGSFRRRALPFLAQFAAKFMMLSNADSMRST